MQTLKDFLHLIGFTFAFYSWIALLLIAICIKIVTVIVLTAEVAVDKCMLILARTFIVTGHFHIRYFKLNQEFLLLKKNIINFFFSDEMKGK